jgi:hypothetical protein
MRRPIHDVSTPADEVSNTKNRFERCKLRLLLAVCAIIRCAQTTRELPGRRLLNKEGDYLFGHRSTLSRFSAVQHLLCPPFPLLALQLPLPYRDSIIPSLTYQVLFNTCSASARPLTKPRRAPLRRSVRPASFP